MFGMRTGISLAVWTPNNRFAMGTFLLEKKSSQRQKKIVLFRKAAHVAIFEKIFDVASQQLQNFDSVDYWSPFDANDFN